MLRFEDPYGLNFDKNKVKPRFVMDDWSDFDNLRIRLYACDMSTILYDGPFTGLSEIHDVPSSAPIEVDGFFVYEKERSIVKFLYFSDNIVRTLRDTDELHITYRAVIEEGWRPPMNRTREFQLRLRINGPLVPWWEKIIPESWR